MTDNKDKLVPTGKLGPLKIGMAAKVAQAQKQGGLASDLFDYSRYPNRIVLCIDDSGSMSTAMAIEEKKQQIHSTQFTVEQNTISLDTRMSTCRKACEEFLSVCDSRDTALGLYTISTGQEYNLSIAYPMLLSKIRELRDSGGTPTIATLDKIISKEKVTRVVVVSDGESGALDYQQVNDNYGVKRILSDTAKRVLDKYKEAKAPIDTVFVGDANGDGETEMRLIAEYTGGLFFVFKSGESFRTKFKYLAPAFRGMLVSGEIKL